MTIGALSLAACETAQPADVAALEATIAAQAAAIAALERRVEALEKAQEAGPPARTIGPGVQTPEFPFVEEESAKTEGGSPPARVFVTTCENDHCAVTRAEVEAVLAEPESLLRTARIVPMLKGGETVGFKLYGIRPDTRPHRLGLRNGDLLRSIAGITLRDLDTAMAIPGKLRELDRFTIEGERDGAPFEITFEVR